MTSFSLLALVINSLVMSYGAGFLTAEAVRFAMKWLGKRKPSTVSTKEKE